MSDEDFGLPHLSTVVDSEVEKEELFYLNLGMSVTRERCELLPTLIIVVGRIGGWEFRHTMFSDPEGWMAMCDGKNAENICQTLKRTPGYGECFYSQGSDEEGISRGWRLEVMTEEGLIRLIRTIKLDSQLS